LSDLEKPSGGSKLDEMNFATSRSTADGVGGAGIQDIAIVSDFDGTPLTGIEVWLQAQEDFTLTNVTGSIGKFSPTYAAFYNNGQWTRRDLDFYFPPPVGPVKVYVDTIIMDVRGPTGADVFEIIASFFAPTTLRLTWLVAGVPTPVIVSATVRGYRP
jgi:hypothetical protein